MHIYIIYINAHLLSYWAHIAGSRTSVSLSDQIQSSRAVQFSIQFSFLTHYCFPFGAGPGLAGAFVCVCVCARVVF